MNSATAEKNQTAGPATADPFSPGSKPGRTGPGARVSTSWTATASR